MRTIIYIDGFNLYYGALRGSPYKWLNVRKMCEILLPKHSIVGIKYYTAKVKSRPHDPGQPTRQQTYLRALETIPELNIIFGQFLQSKVTMPLAQPSVSGNRFARVIKTEEKGSDVNIAAQMVHDAHLGRFECAVLVSNDSDLAEPARIVRQELGMPVGMLNPHRRPSYELKKYVTFVKRVRSGVLRISQFPDTLEDATGRFHKPANW